MTMTKTRAPKTSLSEDEVDLVARALAVSNVGHGGKIESARSPEDIRNAYRLVDDLHAEAGVDLRDEYLYWAKSARKGVKFVLQRWNEIKSRFVKEVQS
jgi:hypothetical protein